MNAFWTFLAVLVPCTPPILWSYSRVVRAQGYKRWMERADPMNPHVHPEPFALVRPRKRQ
jgi:hypothetical protein